MRADTWDFIAKLCFVIAGCCLLFGIYLFRKYDILQVVGFLSGRAKQQEIEQLRHNNIALANKTYRPGVFELEAGEFPFVLEQTQGEQTPASFKEKIAVPAQGVSSGKTALLEELLKTSARADTPKKGKIAMREETVLLGQNNNNKKQGFTVVKDIVVSNSVVSHNGE